MIETRELRRAVIIGAGVGGLTAGAALARAGVQVTVLEAHVYPGGCAGTFYYQGYRFDAGATLAGGFYPGGPMDQVARVVGIPQWPIYAAEPALEVHLPDGTRLPRWADERRHTARQQAFGRGAARFWAWQEDTADALWSLALRLPPWPPQSARQAARLLRQGLDWFRENPSRHGRPALLADAFRPVETHLAGASQRLRLFVDAQLLIAAQATSTTTNALYGAAALDLPRRGVRHLKGGMGSIAAELVRAIERNGGQVHFREEVTRVVRSGGRPAAVETRRGHAFPADLVIFNLPPWNLPPLLEGDLPAKLRRLNPRPSDAWGAFMLYIGLDGTLLTSEDSLHHQVIAGRPLAEGNSLFLSFSPGWDYDRAPLGKRALTISTHTALAPWWELYRQDRPSYEAQKKAYTRRLLLAAEQAFPGLQDAAELTLPGTPLVFQRFTRRKGGWVGGFPQTSLFRNWGPHLAPGLWMVGDSIFPGQSTPAVALGGLRVAALILEAYGLTMPRPVSGPPINPVEAGLPPDDFTPIWEDAESHHPMPANGREPRAAVAIDGVRGEVGP